MRVRTLIACLLLLLAACNKIETGDTLDQSDIAYIQTLGLLDKDEKIYKFYSEHKKQVAGNFFTDKRIAKYWIDERYTEKNIVASAFYSDIKSIDTVYDAGLTYCPYMLVTTTDNKWFSVSVEGSRKEIRSFFEEALQQWTYHKRKP